MSESLRDPTGCVIPGQALVVVGSFRGDPSVFLDERLAHEAEVELLSERECARRDILADAIFLDARGLADWTPLLIGLRRRSDIPIIVTGLDTAAARARALSLGADDCVPARASPLELLARTRAVLRRSGRTPSPLLRLGDLVIDRRRRMAARSGHDLRLTARERDVLTALARRPGACVTKRLLLEEIWGFSGYSHNLIEVHVRALRRKTERYGARIVHTDSVNHGYVLTDGRSRADVAPACGR